MTYSKSFAEAVRLARAEKSLTVGPLSRRVYDVSGIPGVEKLPRALVVLLERVFPVELGVPAVILIARIAVQVMVDEVLGILGFLTDVRAHFVGLREPGEDIDLFRKGGRDAEPCLVVTRMTPFSAPMP